MNPFVAVISTKFRLGAFLKDTISLHYHVIITKTGNFSYL